MIVLHRTSTVKFTDEMGGDFDTQMTILGVGPSEVHLCDLVGSFDRQKRRDLMVYLRSQGVKKYTYERCRDGQWSVYKRKVG